MNSFTLIVFMIVTGSLIAGVTNILAIKMLFKPYVPKYILGVKLPFTPGVIPSRRDEASTKLGKVITGHLLTPDVFIDKIKSIESERFIMAFIERQIKLLEDERLSISYFLERLHEGLSDKIVTGFNDELHTKITEEGSKLHSERLGSLIPHDALNTVDIKVAEIQPQAVNRVEDYILSDKGYGDLYTMVDEFIEHRGRLAKSLKYFMTKDSIVENIQRELVKLIHHPKMTSIQTRFIDDEYNKLKESRLSDFMTDRDREQILTSVSTTIEARINIRGLLNKPIVDFNPELFESFKERGKYRLKDNIISYLSVNMVKIMDKLELAQVIKEQIDSFELDKLEELVMDIARKEFQMITLLGFILGAVVGLVQGLIVVFL